MKTIEEFKEVIEGNYGIINLEAYTDYKVKASQRVLTQEEIEKLSPDNVNSSSFWEYIEKNPELAKDAISFGVTKELSVEEVNLRNFGLACDLSVFNYILKYKDTNGLPILDIGAGYGMLKEFVEKFTKLHYIGVDVYPKIDNIIKIDSEDGSTLPDCIMNTKFGLVVSTNVFQHLSVKQRRHYYEQIAKILYPQWGIFTVTQASHPNNKRIGFKGENGKQYMCHYGQWTEIQSLAEIIEDLEKHFIIISHSQRDISITFHCISK